MMPSSDKDGKNTEGERGPPGWKCAVPVQLLMSPITGSCWLYGHSLRPRADLGTLNMLESNKIDHRSREKDDEREEEGRKELKLKP